MSATQVKTENAPYQGYGPYSRYEWKLPFEKGETVVIPKGVMVHTTHPSIENKPSKRKRTVKVNHTICGSSLTAHCLHWRDVPDSCIPEGELDIVGAKMKFAEEKANEANEYIHEEMGKGIPYDEIKVPSIVRSNPTVNWAGTGGYWFWVDVNDILEANGKSTEVIEIKTKRSRA